MTNNIIPSDNMTDKDHQEPQNDGILKRLRHRLQEARREVEAVEEEEVLKRQEIERMRDAFLHRIEMEQREQESKQQDNHIQALEQLERLEKEVQESIQKGDHEHLHELLSRMQDIINLTPPADAPTTGGLTHG